MNTRLSSIRQTSRNSKHQLVADWHLLAVEVTELVKNRGLSQELAVIQKQPVCEEAQALTDHTFDLLRQILSALVTSLHALCLMGPSHLPVHCWSSPKGNGV